MSAGELVVLGAAAYEARVTPLKTGGRRDVEVTPINPTGPEAFGSTDVLGVLRQFFDRLDQEAAEHEGDPVALSQALARMEAVLADVRHVRDTMRTMTAAALNDERVRRLTVSGVVTVEGTSEVKRTEWRNENVLSALLAAHGYALLHLPTGEIRRHEQAAPALLEWFRPDWKMTAMKQAGIDPDQFCTVATDDDGRTVRTPTVRIVDNIVRRITVTTTTQETDQ